MFCTGEIHAGDRLCAEAEGLFVAVDPERFAEMVERLEPLRSGLEVVAHGVEDTVAQHRPDLAPRHAELLFEGAHRPRRQAVEPEAA